jgi:branched-chain amino acid aminotransferase
MKVWLNGGLLDAADAHVGVDDHGLLVGDGVFETLKVVGGTPFALTRHLRRLHRSADLLGLSLPDDRVIAGAVTDVCTANAIDRGRVRVTVTGGPSPLGSERGEAGPTVVVATASLAQWPPTADVVVVPWPRNERAATAGAKTTSYADNVVALAQAKARGAAEALFGNIAGNLCEGTGSNVFLVLDGRLVTPPLSAGCLAGVTRELVVEWCGAAEEDVPLARLAGASEVFLTSSTRDVQAVAHIDGRPVPAAPGPVTSAAAATFAERSAMDHDP